MWSPVWLLGLSLLTAGSVKDHDPVETAVARGRVFLEMRSFEKAVVQFQSAAAAAPGDVDVAFLLALSLYGAGRYPEAAVPFGRVAIERPDEVLVHEFHGRALFQAGLLEESVAAFMVVERLAPDDARNQNQLGAVLLQLGRGEEALAHFLSAIEKDPLYSVAHYNAGVILSIQGDRSAGERHLTTAHRLDPTDADPAEALADLHREALEYRDAAAWYEEAARRRPDSPRIWMRLGEMQVGMRDLLAADAAYAVACRLPTATAAPFWRRAQVLRGRGDLTGMLQALAGAREREPGNVELELAVADIAEDTGELELARDSLRRVVALGGEAPDLYRRLSKVCEELGGTEESVEVFTELVRRNEGSQEAMVAIAERMVASKLPGIRDIETGAELARALVERSRGKDLAALFVLSRAEVELGDSSAAAETLKRASHLFAEGTPVYALLQRRAEMAVGE